MQVKSAVLRTAFAIVLAGSILIARNAFSEERSIPTGTDCHMHVNPEGEAFPQDANRVLSALEGAGLARGCILSPGYQRPSECQTADCPSQHDWTKQRNDWTLDQARENKNLIPFCGIPINVSWAKEEVLRCAAKGARGLKLHPVSQGLSLTDSQVLLSLDEISLAAADSKLPVLIHIPFKDADIAAFFKIAASHLKTTFILAHQLGPKMAMLSKAPSNVYVDISGLVLAPRAAAPAFVALWRGIGMNRILLGSDWPMLHPSEYVAALRAFPLSDEERRLIISENARRLFP